MRASTKDNVEGTKHQGNGKMTANRDLEIKGKGENLAGNHRGKIGRIKKIVNC